MVRQWWVSLAWAAQAAAELSAALGAEGVHRRRAHVGGLGLGRRAMPANVGPAEIVHDDEEEDDPLAKRYKEAIALMQSLHEEMEERKKAKKASKKEESPKEIKEKKPSKEAPKEPFDERDSDGDVKDNGFDDLVHVEILD